MIVTTLTGMMMSEEVQRRMKLQAEDRQADMTRNQSAASCRS